MNRNKHHLSWEARQHNSPSEKRYRGHYLMAVYMDVPAHDNLHADILHPPEVPDYTLLLGALAVLDRIEDTQVASPLFTVSKLGCYFGEMSLRTDNEYLARYCQNYEEFLYKQYGHIKNGDGSY